MTPIIEVENLSKFYNISHQTDMKASYGTLKDDFAKLLKKPLGRGSSEEENEIFWALKDVSFQVNQGEIFGVIGANGSGKSTLLKILSRIVEPTRGEVKLRGRTASLLEVGTGFHPELTGRENIFFNGSMLGMSRQEIRRKFDEIVSFSGVEKFLDTPVKFYSSGMYVRLAFAVAAHLEPEILILDEVLSVGDVAFQQKSLRKITSTMEEGCTVLIVSHSMDTVKSICHRGLLLRKGKIKSIGPIKDVVRDYTGVLPTLKPTKVKTVKLEGVKILSATVVGTKNPTTDGPLKIEVKFFTDRDLPNCYVNLLVEDSRGQIALHSRTDFTSKNPSFEPGTHVVSVEYPRLSLNSGTYSSWFRLYCEHQSEVQIIDSNRIMIEVKGKHTESSGVVDIPSSWHWSKTSK